MSTADQLHLQAIAQAQQGNLPAAIHQWQQALQQDPNHLLSWQNLAIAQHKLYDFTSAANSNRQALQRVLDPEVKAQLHLNLGAALSKLKDFDGAIASYRAALKLKPDWCFAKRNLGNTLVRTGDVIQAETLLRDVLAQQPDDPENHHGLGNVLREQARYEDALACFQQAITLDPSCAEAHANAGLVKMQLGNWMEGVPQHEWRLKCPDLARLMPTLPLPLWQGEDLRGKTLLLHGDLGLGDALHFMRYALTLTEQQVNVVLHLPKSLVAIARTLSHNVQILSQGEVIDWHSPDLTSIGKPIDYWLLLSSLAYRLLTTPDEVPAPIPYLSAPGNPSPLPIPKQLSSSRPPLKLGIVWESGRLSDTQQQRSTQLHQWQPIAELPNVQLYSLQKERSPEEQTQLQHWQIIDLADKLTDFVATAHYINQLDAVLTVDTAVAHLAGALGKPVYVLLPHVPDWRWQLTGDRTPWYPTMTLIRQPALNRWEPAIAQLAQQIVATL